MDLFEMPPELSQRCRLLPPAQAAPDPLKDVHESLVRLGKAAYQCPWPDCGRIFISRPHVMEHLTVHSLAKNHRCPFPDCGYRCNRPQNLKRHMRLHVNPRPYQCAYPGCSAAFTTNKQLQDHNWDHQDARPYWCRFECGYNTKRFYDCVKHERTRHKHGAGLRCRRKSCPFVGHTWAALNLHRHRAHAFISKQLVVQPDGSVHPRGSDRALPQHDTREHITRIQHV
jgi:uncharacterized Zn-finger protein